MYLCALLLLFLVGSLESRVDSEGMGFFPLLLLTTPWSWLLMGLWDSPIWGSGPQGKYVAIFVTCNIVSGAANGYILYIFRELVTETPWATQVLILKLATAI